jgi:TonB-dependent SusC/RagA subfamily outer membrane receptor
LNKLKIVIIVLACFVLTESLFAQKENKRRVITGIVTDVNQKPVSGAMILIDKKNSNVLTDDKGFYKVKVKPNARQITAFSFTAGTGIAMIERETVINLTLGGSASSEGNTQNQAVPGEDINIGYGVTNSNNLTTPVNKIDADGDKYSSYSSIYDMLRGTVPGVQVTGKTITIRGVSTNNPNSSPLFVVDGNIADSIDDIQPVMVKSITVLQGASASIYGSRGANGVLVITLKGH